MPKKKTKRAAMKRFKRDRDGQAQALARQSQPHPDQEVARSGRTSSRSGDLVSSADFRRVNRLLQA